MSVTQNLKAAVAGRNMPDIRDCLWSSIPFDKTMTGSFKESLDFVFSNGISRKELFQDDDGEVFETIATEKNFYRLGGLLRINFSERKLEALQQMARTLWPPKPTQDRKPMPEPPRPRPGPIDYDNVRDERGKRKEHIPERTIGGDFARGIGNASGMVIDQVWETGKKVLKKLFGG